MIINKIFKAFFGLAHFVSTKLKNNVLAKYKEIIDMKSLTPNERIEASGPPGSQSRIIAIAYYAESTERREAAWNVIDKRARRIELMKHGLTFQEACLFVRVEYGENCTCNET